MFYPRRNPPRRRTQLGYLGIATRRAMGGASGFNPSKPDFAAPLTTNVALTAGTGSASFTRATTAIVCDWESRCRIAKSGEARFQGARRVANLTLKSDDLSDANWTKTNVTAVGGVADPNGGTTAFTVTATLALGSCSQGLGGMTIGNSMRGTWYARRRTGSGALNFLTGQDASTKVDRNATITSSWQRIDFGLVTATATTVAFGVQIAINGDAIDLWHAQLEDVTGQSNQNPAEYVSTGVFSTPFHGAMVDGVKYFDYQNGNTVASSVVTEATGAALSTSILLGYLSEQQSTNLVLQSENFGTTWSAVGTPTRSAGALRCGMVLLDLIGDDDAAALEGYSQTVTFTGDGIKAISFYFAQGTATQSWVDITDSTAVATRLTVNITWSVGVPTCAVPTGTLLGVDTLGNGVFRCRVMSAAITAANVNSLRFFPASVAGSIAPVGNGYFGGVQAENLTFCSSYIPTTTATVTRNTDALSYPAAGNILGTVGTLYAEGIVDAALSASFNRVLITADITTTRGLCSETTTVTGRMLDGTNTVQKATAAGSHKFAGTYSGSAMNSYVDGVGASGSFDGDINVGASIGIGSGPGAGSPFSNGIKNIRIWKSLASDAQVAAL